MNKTVKTILHWFGQLLLILTGGAAGGAAATMC